MTTTISAPDSTEVITDRVDPLAESSFVDWPAEVTTAEPKPVPAIESPSPAVNRRRQFLAWLLQPKPAFQSPRDQVLAQVDPHYRIRSIQR